ncbi:ABC transporter ATP-binding protein [Anaeromassilibacillus senegalensis]|uniref:ABC transporter ATP-binding protein n=1 Tax=Anaeromassilibacillus senegalensis TaxID=1673717 RepID=A0ABS9CP59_9FIRM|nr:ABC transporter ATP-binding protein [Anaeromassilibacillus senegalensis]MCF2651739.1 ABC transporter ATP-binding protein [Anaeromassilibacillus senegalensis]
MYAIQTANLTKKYDDVVALFGLDLEVEAGSIVGYLGPNGSGKTTTVKLLTGLIQPTLGDSTVLGLSSAKESGKIHALTGVLTETAACYRHLTAMENLRFFGALFGLEDAKIRTRAEHLLKKLDLWSVRDRKAGTFSTGMKQRLSLARALIHTPQVLFLDEPTSGLDPESASIVNRMIGDMARDEGTTVLLCTHQLRYADEICSSFAILDQGILRASGSLEMLGNAAGLHPTASLRVADGAEMPEDFVQNGGFWEKEIREDQDMPGLISELIRREVPIYEALIRRPTLEDAYFSLVQKPEDGEVENRA